jgi:hypothetical protein
MALVEFGLGGLGLCRPSQVETFVFSTWMANKYKNHTFDYQSLLLASYLDIAKSNQTSNQPILLIPT